MQRTYSHESEALHVFDALCCMGFLDGDEQWGAICEKRLKSSTLSHSVPIQILYVTDYLIDYYTIVSNFAIFTIA